MGSSIASLVVDLGARNTGLRRGLDESNGYLRQFAKDAQYSLSLIGKSDGTYSSAKLATREFVRDTQAQFRSLRSSLTEQFARGIIDKAAFNREMREVEESMRASLIGGLTSLRGQFGPAMSKALQADVTEAMRGLGASGAQAFNQGFGQYGPQTLKQSLLRSFPNMGNAGIGQLGPSTLGATQRAEAAARNSAISQFANVRGYGSSLPTGAYGPITPQQFKSNQLREQFPNMGNAGVGQLGPLTLGQTQAAADKLKKSLSGAEEGFTGLQRRGTSVAIGLGFALEGFANGTDGYMRRALRSVAIFAAAFGAPGLIVSSIAIATQAVYDFFNKAAKEAATAARDAKKEFKELETSGNDFTARTRVQTARQGLVSDLGEKSQIETRLDAGGLRKEASIARYLPQSNRGAHNQAINAAVADLNRLDEINSDMVKLRAQISAGSDAIANPNKYLPGFSPDKIAADIDVFKNVKNLIASGAVGVGPKELADARKTVEADLKLVNAVVIDTLKKSHGNTGPAKEVLSAQEQLTSVLKPEKGPKIDVERLDSSDIVHGVDLAIHGYGDLGDAIKAARDRAVELDAQLKKTTGNAPTDVKKRNQIRDDLLNVTEAGDRGAAYDPGAAALKIQVESAQEILGELQGSFQLLKEGLLKDSDMSGVFNQLQSSIGVGYDGLKKQMDTVGFPNLTKEQRAALTEFRRMLSEGQQLLIQSSAQTVLQPFNKTVDTQQGNVLSNSISAMLGHGKKTDLKTINADARKAVEEAAKAVLNSDEYKALSADSPVRHLVDQALKSGVDSIGGSMDLTTDSTRKWIRELDKAKDALYELTQLIPSSGPNGHLGNALGATVNAVGDVTAAAKSGGTDPAADIKAGVSIIKAAVSFTTIGKDIQKENNQVLKQNNDRLTELDLTMKGFIDNASNNLKAQDALKPFLADASARAAFQKGATHGGGLFGQQEKGDLQTQINALQPFLDKAGITYDELKKIADDRHINLFDSSGRLLLGGLSDLEDAILKNSAIITTYNDHLLSDVQSKTALGNTINDVQDTPQQRIKDDIATLQSVDKPIAARFAGLNPDSPQDQNAIREVLKGIFADITSGKLTAADLGDLTDIGQLTGIISDTAGSLNDLQNTVDAVNTSLTNVPDGFKIALASFDATTGLNVQDPTYASTLEPAASSVPLPTVLKQLQVSVDKMVLPAGSTQDQARSILEMLETIAAQQFGNSTDWSEVNSGMIPQ